MSDAKLGMQATPQDTLEAQITNPNFPKNEREWWAYHEIKRLRADNERLRRDAAIGDVVWKFIDRMTDVDDSCDPADRILREFVAAVEPAIDAALAKGCTCLGDDDIGHTGSCPRL